jgi:hypothetical protein
LRAGSEKGECRQDAILDDAQFFRAEREPHSRKEGPEALRVQRRGEAFRGYGNAGGSWHDRGFDLSAEGGSGRLGPGIQKARPAGLRRSGFMFRRIAFADVHGGSLFFGGGGGASGLGANELLDLGCLSDLSADIVKP